jgi:hypothetical protein
VLSLSLLSACDVYHRKIRITSVSAEKTAPCAARVTIRGDGTIVDDPTVIVSAVLTPIRVGSVNETTGWNQVRPEPLRGREIPLVPTGDSVNLELSVSLPSDVKGTVLAQLVVRRNGQPVARSVPKAVELPGGRPSTRSETGYVTEICPGELTVDTTQPITRFQLSGDGRYVVFESANVLRVFDTVSGTVGSESVALGIKDIPFAVGQDLLLTIGGRVGLQAWEIPGLKLLWERRSFFGERIGCLAMAPGRADRAVVSLEGTSPRVIAVLDIDRWAPAFDLNGQPVMWVSAAEGPGKLHLITDSGLNAVAEWTDGGRRAAIHDRQPDGSFRQRRTTADIVGPVHFDVRGRAYDSRGVIIDSRGNADRALEGQRVFPALDSTLLAVLERDDTVKAVDCDGLKILNEWNHEDTLSRAARDWSASGSADTARLSHQQGHLVFVGPDRHAIVRQGFGVMNGLSDGNTDAILVLSPTHWTAELGRAWQQQLDTVATRGHVIARLVGGPPGLTMSESGVLNWTPIAEVGSRHEVFVELRSGSARRIWRGEIIVGRAEQDEFRADSRLRTGAVLNIWRSDAPSPRSRHNNFAIHAPVPDPEPLGAWLELLPLSRLAQAKRDGTTSDLLWTRFPLEQTSGTYIHTVQIDAGLKLPVVVRLAWEILGAQHGPPIIIREQDLESAKLDRPKSFDLRLPAPPETAIAPVSDPSRSELTDSQRAELSMKILHQWGQLIEAHHRNFATYPHASIGISDPTTVLYEVEKIVGVLRSPFAASLSTVDAWGGAITYGSDGRGYVLIAPGADRWIRIERDEHREPVWKGPYWDLSMDIVYLDGQFVQYPGRVNPQRIINDR